MDRIWVIKKRRQVKAKWIESKYAEQQQNIKME